MKKKIVAVAIVLSMLMAVLAGCTPKDTAENKDPVPTQGVKEEDKDNEKVDDEKNNDAKAEKAEVTLWHYYTTTNGEIFEQMVAEYNALPDGKANVTLELIPRNELLKKYTLGVVSGELPDLAIVDNPDTASFAAMGMYYDMTDLYNNWEDNQFMSGPLNSGKYQDKQFAVPLRSNCLGLYVNNEHFKAAGIDKIPTTWDELMETSEKLKAVNENVYPLAFSAIKSEEGTFQFMPFYQSTGATVNDANSEAGVRAFDLLDKLAKNDYVSDEIINWTQGDVEKQFASGNASMMIGGTWQIPNLMTDAPDMDYTISYIPKDVEYSSSLGGENIGITKAAEDPEAAWDFVTWILNTENNVRFNTLGGAISPKSDITPEDQYPDNEKMQIFIEQIEYAVARGPHAKWSEVSSAFQEGIQQTLTGAKAPADVAAEIGAKVAKINETIE